MSKLEIAITVNYEFILDNFSKNRGLVLPGGTRSTKTISILQFLIIYALYNPGVHIVVARDTLKNLKRTVLKDFIELCYGYGDYAPHAQSMILNKSELTATVGLSTFEFIGLIDDPMRVHGLKSDIFYINEAIGTYKATFSQLNYRCSEGWLLDCNPSEPNHWVYELEKRSDVEFFRTSYLDNPFLNAAQVKEIESKEPTEKNIQEGTADEREWAIYGQGLVYKGKEIIYPKWNTFDDYPETFDWKMYGLDWGWNHPMAVTEVVCKGNSIYVKEVIYQSELELEDMVDILKAHKGIMSGESYVVCDSAEPRSINRLIKSGISAVKADKRGGSVISGIRKLQSMNIFIHEDSINIQNEANNYKFKVDTRNDTILDVPVKENDDAWDSIRYPVDMFC